MSGTTVQPASRGISPALLDRTEQVLILALWVWLVQRVLRSLASGLNPDSWLLLISETAVMIFTLIRRPTKAISLDLGDWMLAITATAAPLLILPAPEAFPALRPLGYTLVMLGNLGQAAAKLALARSFGIAPANRGVKVSGAYRFVRHPMYAGYLWVHIGVLMLMPTMLNAAIYAIGWTAQIRRLLAEEALLGQDEAYRAYAAKVRWRLVPGVF